LHQRRGRAALPVAQAAHQNAKGPAPRALSFSAESRHTLPAGAHYRSADVDVDEGGNGTLDRPRLHQLIREPRSITDRTFEITFGAPGAEAYCFTFG
jgi:hypothetical protein